LADFIERKFWERAKSFGKQVISFKAFTKYFSTEITFGRKGILNFNASNITGADPLRIMAPNRGSKVNPEKVMAHIHGWAYAAIKAIADEISCIEFQVFTIKEDGTHEEVFEHELLDLLEAGNPDQTGAEIKWTIASHLEAVGNAYGLLMGVKSEEDKPTAIFLLNPAFVKPDIDKTIYPYVLKGYKYDYDNRKYYYKPYEIVHLKLPDSNNPYEGIGTMQSIAEWIDNDNFAMEYNRQFFLNGAHMDGVFETEYTTEEQILALKSGYESNHQGVENANKVGILPKGVKWKQTTSSMKDMDFSKLLDMTRDRILAGFRVSKTILGTAESDTNRATAETADYVFSKRTIKPKMELICSYLNEYLAPRYGENIYITFKDPTPEDKNFRVEEMKAMAGSQPVMSINEVRENYAGLGEIDGGDDVMMANNLVKVGTMPKDNPPAPTKSKMFNTKKLIKTRAAMNFKARKKINEEMASNLIAKLKAIKQKKLNEMTKDEYYAVWKDFVSRVEKVQPEVKDAIKALNAKQKKEVLANLPDLFGKSMQLDAKSMQKAVIPDLFNIKNWIGLTIDAMTPILTELYKKEGEIAAAAFGKPGIDITEVPAAKTALDERIALLAQSYNETTMAQLKDKLAESLKLGNGIQQATDLVEGVYGIADTTGAERIATTETFAVANQAQKMGWIDSGVVKTLKWVAFSDSTTCQFCQEMDGKIISVDDNFLNNGDSVTGKDGGNYDISYADVGSPPLHPNCRCGIQPDELVE
jgi:HK97 family phage portal protein